MNMRDKCGALMLMLSLFAFLAQCRPHQQLDARAARRRAYILTNTTLDGSKPEQLCYDTMHECQVACPVCKPKCPPVQSTIV
uniref:4Fe-4S ferredoxin-type domain-containing protein n=1 Tax=Setaria viridis TaxID=4556 RepID=A0A4U6V6X6_SETVI|nr:hypothetical protein SEVIR_3G007400v2 [Setaria viridis]